jgi:hypothetical protein
MKKRAKTISKSAKAGPHKALKRKGRSAAKALSDLRVATARETDVARLTRELNEARASIVLPNQKTNKTIKTALLTHPARRLREWSSRTSLHDDPHAS